MVEFLYNTCFFSTERKNKLQLLVYNWRFGFKCLVSKEETKMAIHYGKSQMYGFCWFLIESVGRLDLTTHTTIISTVASLSQLWSFLFVAKKNLVFSFETT